MPEIAKLSRPRVEGLVRRQRLFARLDEITDKAAAWISGPPGAGNTSLSASWIEARGAVLREALSEAPAGVSTIVISRTEPPPELARARANRRLVELGWDELRLNLEEAQGLAAATGTAGAHEVEALVARCDGWAAG